MRNLQQLNLENPLRVGIIGEGIAARSLAHTFKAIPFSKIQFFGKHDVLHNLNEVDIVFLAVPDDTLADVCLKLSGMPLPAVVAYLSGATQLQHFGRLFARTSIAQFHPMAALNGYERIPAQTMVGICSTHSEAACGLHDLAHQMQLRPVHIKDGSQALYHAAAAIASNLSMVLFHDAIRALASTGLSEDEARKGISILVQSALKNLEHSVIEDALTGPIKRGDLRTIEAHLDAFKEIIAFKEIEERYRALSSDLLKLSSLTEEKKQQMKELLTQRTL